MDKRFSQSDYLLLEKFLLADTDSVHFVWKCSENEIISIDDTNFFPENTLHPFEYIRSAKLVDEQYEPFFDVFSSRIEEGIFSGIETDKLNIDIKMKLTPDGESRFCHINSRFLRDEAERIKYIHCIIRPFTEKEEFDREIIAFFSSDKNPKIYTNKIIKMMNENKDKNIAFIQFDVEKFKLINDTYGAEFGDDLLQFINLSLEVICTKDQPSCRLTADVFMVVTPFENNKDLMDFVHMIESRLSGYKGIEYRFIFGICVVDGSESSTRRYGDNASMARQSIKGNALENIAFYNNGMISSLHRQKNIEDDMYKAAINNEFVMYLQPKYCISTGKIIGAEALARWIHPHKGMIPPAEFIPAFEKNGFIVKLDKIIWESACRKIRSWIDRGIEPVPISVNVSREYLTDTTAVDTLSALIKKYKIPTKLLELEITETVESAGVEAAVKKFKEQGFTMLMDDFGSGYSSLNMLKTTQFDVLKIDRGFLSEFMESDRGRKIILHTITMSQDIGLDIIAEGVETRDQASFLCSCGCDAAQGFLYSRPIPDDEFDIKLAENMK